MPNSGHSFLRTKKTGRGSRQGGIKIKIRPLSCVLSTSGGLVVYNTGVEVMGGDLQMCNMLRQSISSQVMQTLASLFLHYDQIPTAHLALKYTFIYWRGSNDFVAVLIYFADISLDGGTR